MPRIEFNKKNLPEGTRFIYKNYYGELCDGRIYEWSPSEDYVSINGQWYNIHTESFYRFTVVEILSKENVYVN
jgi:hypothetical protein